MTPVSTEKVDFSQKTKTQQNHNQQQNPKKKSTAHTKKINALIFSVFLFLLCLFLDFGFLVCFFLFALFFLK